MHIRNLQRSVNDMEELVSLERQPLGIEDLPDAGPDRDRQRRDPLRARRVSTTARMPKPLYDNFSVRIAPGERVGLVGHSGSGKTTFIKLIQRLYDISEGRITIDGQDIAHVRQASLRSQIAIVQQEPVLFHRSLAENIAYARPGASRAEIERAAKLASAHDFIAALPNGYDTLVGERGVKLSGGERQRVAIARAFLADAPILILDEATSSLDSESEVLIQQAMERLMMGRTTLVVAHRLSTVRALDRLLVLDKGKVIEEGSHDALIRLENGLYRRLFERQALELIKGLGESDFIPETAGAKTKRRPTGSTTPAWSSESKTRCALAMRGRGRFQGGLYLPVSASTAAHWPTTTVAVHAGTATRSQPRYHARCPRLDHAAGSPMPRAMPVAANTINTSNIVWITLKRA